MVWRRHFLHHRNSNGEPSSSSFPSPSRTTHSAQECTTPPVRSENLTYGWPSKNRGKNPKMDGENNGKPYFKMDDLGGKPTIFGNINMIWTEGCFETHRKEHTLNLYQQASNRSWLGKCVYFNGENTGFTPWKINMEPTNHPFIKENDLPNLHDYVPRLSSGVYSAVLIYRFFWGGVALHGPLAIIFHHRSLQLLDYVDANYWFMPLFVGCAGIKHNKHM